MQPPRRKRRQNRQEPRPEAPLVYERLSDPILVKRAKDGDRRALAALCERHAPRVERLARTCSRSRGRPRRRAGVAREALRPARQFRGESQFATWLHRLVVNTCRDVAERQRGAACEPLLEDARVARDADPAREAERAELRAELARPRRALAGAGARRRPEGRARLLVRGDLGATRDAGRHGEVLRAPRPSGLRAAAFESRRRDAPSGARRSRRSSRTATRSSCSTRCSSSSRASASSLARRSTRRVVLAGHFPGSPIMPGVMMVEALAQAGAVAVLSQEENRGKLALFAGIDDVRFKRIVEPGDELDARVRRRDRARPDRQRQGAATRGRRARRARDADLRGGAG